LNTCKQGKTCEQRKRFYFEVLIYCTFWRNSWSKSCRP